jgi:hypothetical protein
MSDDWSWEKVLQPILVERESEYGLVKFPPAEGSILARVGMTPDGWYVCVRGDGRLVYDDGSLIPADTTVTLVSRVYGSPDGVMTYTVKAWDKRFESKDVTPVRRKRT